MLRTAGASKRIRIRNTRISTFGIKSDITTNARRLSKIRANQIRTTLIVSKPWIRAELASLNACAQSAAVKVPLVMGDLADSEVAALTAAATVVVSGSSDGQRSR